MNNKYKFINSETCNGKLPTFLWVEDVFYIENILNDLKNLQGFSKYLSTIQALRVDLHNCVYSINHWNTKKYPSIRNKIKILKETTEDLKRKIQNE
jgi:hypothetical protein